jgi:pentose-5-phosphate-3-epimerase
MLDEINPEAVVEIDGGMNTNTLPQALKAGVQAFVAAHAVFDHLEGIEAGVRALRACFPD